MTSTVELPDLIAPPQSHLTQSNYNEITSLISKHLLENKLSPEQTYLSLQSNFPKINPETLKQLHIQYIQRYMMHRAPALFQYLDTACKFQETETLEDFKKIVDGQVSAPAFWLFKHCLNKAKFWEALKQVDGLRRLKMDCGALAVLPAKNVAQYVCRNPFDILSQLNKILDEEQNSKSDQKTENDEKIESDQNNEIQKLFEKCEITVSPSKQVFCKNPASEKVFSKQSPSKSNPQSPSKQVQILPKITCSIKIRNFYETIQHLVKVGDRDMVYGSTNVAKLHKQGLEAEQDIAAWLDENNCGYHSEKDLKAQGYDKTPDFLLTVPVILQFHDSCEGVEKQPDMLIHWIESKAMFGDRENIVSHYKDQLEPYFQRFGAGIIMYSKGCIGELKRDFSNQSIKIVTVFPKKLVKHSALDVNANSWVPNSVQNGIQHVVQHGAQNRVQYPTQNGAQNGTQNSFQNGYQNGYQNRVQHRFHQTADYQTQGMFQNGFHNGFQNGYYRASHQNGHSSGQHNSQQANFPNFTQGFPALQKNK